MTGIHGKEKKFPWFKRAAAVVALLVLILPVAAWPAPVTPVQPDNEDDDDEPVVEMQAEPDDEPATAPAPAVEGQPAQPAVNAPDFADIAARTIPAVANISSSGP